MAGGVVMVLLFAGGVTGAVVCAFGGVLTVVGVVVFVGGGVSV